MKKTLILLLSALMIVFTITACGNEKDESDKKLTTGDTWEVPGQWKLTINSVKHPELESDSTHSSENLVTINYKYQNLGFDHYSDLSIYPTAVKDSKGNSLKPLNLLSQKAPGSAPIGAIYEDANVTYELSSESEYVEIDFSVTADESGNYENHINTFHCPITK